MEERIIKIEDSKSGDFAQQSRKYNNELFEFVNDTNETLAKAGEICTPK
jgi:hypothetical protein